MKVSKLSLIFLSGLLCTQATMPMETPQKSILAKAQKAGRTALKIGVGTATLGAYALLGTATLASLGITLGAVAAAPFLYYLRNIKSKTAIPAGNAVIEAPAQPAQNQAPKSVKRPTLTPQRSKSAPKNRASLCTKTAVKAASMVGLAVVENDMLDADILKESRMNREQVRALRHQKALEIKAELEKCNEQTIEWTKDYRRNYFAELPRYEGPYQDMMGIYDGDVQDKIAENRAEIKAQMDHNWEQLGCKESIEKMQNLARRMAQDQMRLPKF